MIGVKIYQQTEQGREEISILCTDWSIDEAATILTLFDNQRPIAVFNFEFIEFFKILYDEEKEGKLYRLK